MHCLQAATCSFWRSELKGWIVQKKIVLQRRRKTNALISNLRYRLTLISSSLAAFTYCNFVYYKHPKPQLSRPQQIQNSLARTVVKAPKSRSPVLSLPSYALSTDSGSLNASNTSSCLLLTMFSQLSNLHTFITSSSFNVLAVLALHPSLHLSATDIILSKNN